MYKTKVIKNGLSEKQKTELSARLFFGGFTSDKNGKNIYPLPMVRRERHYIEAGYLGETRNGYFLELRNVGMDELKEAHSKLVEIVSNFNKQNI